jgi:hypothetical protein
MENKYYTPGLEEFHIGFEYQYRAGVNTWIDCVINDFSEVTDSDGSMNSDIPWYGNSIENFRVKYLDEEDIEECEWAYHSTCGNIRFVNERGWKLYLNDDCMCGIEDAKADTIFLGQIKNKSQFKRLIEQLNVNE